MKFTGRLRWFSPAMRAAACLTLAIPPLTACSSASLNDAAPASAYSRPSPQRPTQPDGYPNLNIPPRAAAAQLTDSERAQMIEDLANSREAQQNGADPAQSAAEAERLRRLSQSHANERLKAIEATQQ